MIMLYLIESGDFYKIGYTKQLEHRLKEYSIYNPNFNLVCSKEGDLVDETLLHRKCKEYWFRNEWYYKSEYIKTLFEEYIPDEEERSSYIQCRLKRKRTVRVYKTHRKRIKRNQILQFDTNNVFIRVWETQTEAQTFIKTKGISKVLDRNDKTCGGFKWKSYSNLTEEEKTSLKICGETTLKME